MSQLQVRPLPGWTTRAFRAFAPLAPWRSCQRRAVLAGVGLMALGSFPLLAQIQGVEGGALASDALRQAQEREDQRRSQLLPQPDGRLSRPLSVPALSRLPTGETPCFPIEAVELVLVSPAPLPLRSVLAALSGPEGDDPPQGKCLGARGAALLVERAQNALIEQGFITTRVFAGPQDLSTGRLALQVVPGRIGAIRQDGKGARATLANALPMGPGDLLNLRDVEQALENLRRVPTVQADIRLEPSAQPGHSDLVVRWEQDLPWRLLLTADDSADKASGRYQGSVTVSHDHALALNDLMYVTYSHDLGGGDPGALVHRVLGSMAIRWSALRSLA